jgi:hypothetical protein
VTAAKAKRPDGPPADLDDDDAGDCEQYHGHVDDEVSRRGANHPDDDFEAAAMEDGDADPQIEQPRARGPPLILALTIPQFCKSHNISEAFYYELQKQGRGPRTMRVGRRRLISLEAAKEWREQNTAAA